MTTEYVPRLSDVRIPRIRLWLGLAFAGHAVELVVAGKAWWRVAAAVAAAGLNLLIDRREANGDDT